MDKSMPAANKRRRSEASTSSGNSAANSKGCSKGSREDCAMCGHLRNQLQNEKGEKINLQRQVDTLRAQVMAQSKLSEEQAQKIVNLEQNEKPAEKLRQQIKSLQDENKTKRSTETKLRQAKSEMIDAQIKLLGAFAEFSMAFPRGPIEMKKAAEGAAAQKRKFKQEPPEEAAAAPEVAAEEDGGGD